MLLDGILEEIVFEERNHSISPLLNNLMDDGMIEELNNFSFVTLRVGEENKKVYFKADSKDDQKVKKPVDIEELDFLEEQPNIGCMWLFRIRDNIERARENILNLKSEFPNAKFYKYGRIIIVFDGSEYKFFRVTSEGEVIKAEVIREFGFNLSTENKRLPDKISEKNQMLPYNPSFWRRLRNRIFGIRSTNHQIQENYDSKKGKSAKERRIEMVKGMTIEGTNGGFDGENKSTEESQKHNIEGGRI